MTPPWHGRVVWVKGAGRFACVSYCRGTTVTLCPTLAAALNAKEHIDRRACCGRCLRKHEVVEVDGEASDC